MSVQFERTVDVKPGTAGPNGFHGCEVIFVLRGPHGVVTFAVFTDWLPKQAQVDATKGLAPRRLGTGIQPVPLEFAFHSPKPSDNVRSTKRTDCPYVAGDCYSSFSPATAEYLRDTLLTYGSGGVWQELEQRYRSAAVVTQSGSKQKP